MLFIILEARDASVHKIDEILIIVVLVTQWGEI